MRLESLALGPARDLGVEAFACLDERREDVSGPRRAAVSTCLTMAARLCFSTGRSQSGQNCVPVLAKSSRRK